MADKDPKDLHEAQALETVTVPDALQVANKAKRKKFSRPSPQASSWLGVALLPTTSWSRPSTQ
jgi:hypothetical protein